MTEIGEIKYGRDIGVKEDSRTQRQRFIWNACGICGKTRWIRLRNGKSSSQICKHCCGVLCATKLAGRVGDKSPSWKGGRRINRGYIQIKLLPDDFFYPMANKLGYVYEHRLVMARHLKRCLLPWELVHHKGVRVKGIKNRSDNLRDNLELLPSRRDHLVDTYLKSYIERLESRIKSLEKELKEYRENEN